MYVIAPIWMAPAVRRALMVVTTRLADLSMPGTVTVRLLYAVNPVIKLFASKIG